MKHHFIVNPAAGKGKALRLIPEIHRLMGKSCDYTVEVTQKPGDATHIARNYAAGGNCRIYSVGGDGTLNEIVNGMAFSRSSLAAIPAGSGNDFIRSLCSCRNTEKLLEGSIEGVEKRIDLGKVNGRYFINIASIGFDAEVVYNTLNFKGLPLVSGSLAYLLGILKAMLMLENPRIRILVDGMPTEAEILLAAVCNGRYYGGGMQPAPNAELDDEILDLCLIRKKKRLEILKFLPLFRKGKHGGIEGVSFFKAQKIKIICDRPLSLNIDGEVERVPEAEFETAPAALSIIVPRIF